MFDPGHAAPISVQQLIFRIREVRNRYHEYQRAPGAEDPFLDECLKSSVANVEFFNEYLSKKQGPIRFLLRDPDYRACAGQWLDIIDNWIENHRSGYSTGDPLYFEMYSRIGDVAVLCSASIIVKHATDLIALRAPAATVEAQLEQQVVRERRRRAVMIPLLQRHAEVHAELLERWCQSGLLERAIGERVAESHGSPPSGPQQVGLLREAERRKGELTNSVLLVFNEVQRFLLEYREPARVRVHDLDGRTGEILRSRLTALQLQVEGLHSGYWRFLERYRILLEAEPDEDAATVVPPRLPVSRSASPIGVPLAAAKPEVGVEPAPLPARESLAPPQPVPVAPGSTPVRHDAPAKSDASGGRAKTREPKKRGSKKGRKQTGGFVRAPTVARPLSAAEPLRINWGDERDGLWAWLEEGIVKRFRRETLDSIVQTQFEKAGRFDRVPGQIRSPSIPNWIEGALGHHTLPRSNLTLFFVRDRVQVCVVGVGEHANDRKRNNKSYDVFWWREDKGKAVGPKRLSL